MAYSKLMRNLHKTSALHKTTWFVKCGGFACYPDVTGGMSHRIPPLSVTGRSPLLRSPTKRNYETQTEVGIRMDRYALLGKFAKHVVHTKEEVSEVHRPSP